MPRWGIAKRAAGANIGPREMDMTRILRRLFLAVIGLAALLAAGTPADAHQGHAMAAEQAHAEAGTVPDARHTGHVPCHEAAKPDPDASGKPAPGEAEAPAGADGHGCAGAWGCCLAVRRDADPGRMMPPRRAGLGPPPSDARTGRVPLVALEPPIPDRD